jgi:adenylate cyclase
MLEKTLEKQELISHSDSGKDGANATSADADSAAVEEALARILASEKFRASERLRQFLVHVVRESLAGRAQRIKAYSIATEVFGRGVDFNPTIDPIVRIEAARLRRSLDHYYLTAGVNDPLVIQIPKGGYAPTFREGSAKSPDTGMQPKRDASVVVIPLRDLTGDPAQAYFAAGMTEELHSALGQYPSIRSVQVTPGGAEKAASEVIEQSLATFALLGSVRKASDTVRVTVQLIESSTGSQVWAQTYDRTLTADNLITVQDDIAHKVVVNIAEIYGGAIAGSLARESRDEQVLSLTTYDAVLHLHYYYNPGWNESVWRQTRESLEQALETEPDSVPVQVALAEILTDGLACGIPEASEADIDRAEDILRKALSLDPEYEYGFFPLGLAKIARRERGAVVGIAQRLLNQANALTTRLLGGWLLVVAGEYELGEPIVRECTRQLSKYPRWVYHALMLCHLARGEYEDALAEADAFEMPGLLWSPLNRAITLAFLGDVEGARRAYADACEIQPEIAVNPRRYIGWFILDDKLVDEIMNKLQSHQLLECA